MVTLSYNGVTLVDVNSRPGDAFNVADYNLGGTGGWGGSGYTATWDGSTLSQFYSWGSVKCQYSTPSGKDWLVVTITVTNISGQTLNGINIYPFGIQFPVLPQNFGASNYPQFHNNLDGPSIISADYGTGMAVLSNGDAQPLFLGLTPSGAAYHYGLLLGTLGNSNEGFLPSAIPVSRPIAAGQSATYSFSLRFAPSGTDYHSIAGDVLTAYSQAWPQQLQWSDRRPIGELFMTAPASAPIPSTSPNPRNYNVASNINIQTSQGLAAFQQAMLAYADNAIRILQKMNAQGAIVWDLEGQQYPQPNTSYVGDPTLLATMSPEMNSVADAFFQKFRNAGLRCGMTLRPQKMDFSVSPPNQVTVPIQNQASLLIQKVQYAYNRWGCTIFYVDSDGGPYDSTAPSTFQQVAQAVPGVLIIPENVWIKDYAYTAPLASFTAPYKPLHTPADALTVWPRAFSVTYVGDAPNNDLNNNPNNPNQFNQFVQAVKNGDILSFRAWFDDEPLNSQVQQIYQMAGVTGSAPADFSLLATPVTAAVTAGGNAIFTVTAAASGGFAGSVALSASGLPAGATGTFSPTAIAGGSGSSTFTVGVPASLAPGTYTVTISGASGALAHTASVGLTVSAPADFSLSAAPAAATVTAGGNATFTATAAALGGFAGAVALSASGLPAGATGAFSPTAIAGGSGSSTFTIGVPASLAPGAYTVTISGASGALVHTASVGLTVSAPADFSLSATPAATTVTAGGNATFTVSATASGGFAGAVALSASGLPAGVTGTFSPTAIAGGSGSSSFTIGVPASLAPGTYTVAISGASGALVHTTSVAVTVSAPATVPPTGVTLVQQAAGANGGNNQNTLTVTLPHTPGSGNVLVLIFDQMGASQTITSISGANWTRVAQNYTSSNGDSEIWVGTNPSSSTITITGTNYFGTFQPGYAIAAEFSGVSAALDGAPVLVKSGIWPVTTGSMATSNPGDVLITAATSYNGGGTQAKVSGPWTLLGSPAGTNSLAAAYQTVTTTGSYSATWSGSGTPQVSTILLALKAGSSAAASDFSLSATPAAATVTAGGNATFTVNAAASGGFAGTVALSASGLPAGATGTFSPTAIAGGSGSSSFTIGVPASLAPGTYTVTISGASGALVHTASVGLTVSAPTTVPPNGVTLVQQAAGANGGNNQNTLTVSLPHSPGSGNVLVLIFSQVGASQTITSISGANWTRLAQNSNNGDSEIWVGTNPSSSTITITGTNYFGTFQPGYAIAAEFSGVSAALDGAPVLVKSGIWPVTTGSMATGNPGDVLITSAMSYNGGGTQATVSSPWTLLGAPAGTYSLAAAYQTVTTTGSYSATWSGFGTPQVSTILLALKAGSN